MNHLVVTRVEARAQSGSTAYDCAHDAAVLALSEERIVTFDHNGQTYTADPEVIVKQIIGTVSPPF